MPYTTSQAGSGQGSTLEICLATDSPPNYLEVGELKSWSPERSWEMKDPTNLSSSQREEKPVLQAVGRVSTTVNRVPTDDAQELLQSAYDQASLMRFRFTAAPVVEAGQTTGDEWVFLGYCTQWQPDIQTGELQMNRLGLSLNKLVSYTPGSTS